jgi:hypothetical protein
LASRDFQCWDAGDRQRTTGRISDAKRFSKHRFESFGVSEEAKIGGMRPIGGVVAIAAKERFAVDIEQSFDAGVKELLVLLLQCRPTGEIAFRL